MSCAGRRWRAGCVRGTAGAIRAEHCAPLRLGPRDHHLGRGDGTRGARIRHVLCNDRFLLRAGLQVPNLASWALGRVLRRDWAASHGVRPWLLETCVEASRPGTCYRAADFQCVGHTAGKPPGAQAAVEPKSVWLRGLAAAWEQALRRVPERRLGTFPELVLAEQASRALLILGLSRSEMAICSRIRSTPKRLEIRTF